jgi:Flp pilus assembly protein TadD
MTDLADGGDPEDRARALIHLGRYAEAVAVARAGLATAPDDPELALLLAIALCETDEIGSGVEVARRAVALQPGNPRAHRTLGWALHAAGRPAEAADTLARALSLDPEAAMAHVMRAEALLAQTWDQPWGTRSRSRTVLDADEHAGEAVRLRPDSADGYIVRAKVAAARRRADDVESWARQALAIDPAHPVAHQMLAVAAQLRGDVRTAADHLVEAGRLDPHSGEPVEMLRRLRPGPILTGLGGIAVGLAVVFVPGLVLLVLPVALFYRSRWRARQAMSDEARMLLARDRELRSRPGWRPRWPSRP